MASVRPASNQRQPLKDWMTVIVFDGEGGVRTLAETEEASFTAPETGLVLIAGSAKAPEFKIWLRREIGDFFSDQATAGNSRSRCTVFDDRALVVLRVVRPSAEPHDVGRQLISLRLEANKVIIVSDLNIVELLGIGQWQMSHNAPRSPGELVARLALRAADRIEPLVEALSERLDSVEEEIMLERNVDSRHRLAELRRTLISMRRLIWPQRDALNTLEIEDLSFLTDRDRGRLREAGARTARLGDELQGMSERAVLVHEHLIDMRAETMNKAILVLTAVTVVFMPLTLVSGVLGMNVAGIPFSEQPWAFWGVVAGLVVTAGVVLLWMRTRKWL